MPKLIPIDLKGILGKTGKFSDHLDIQEGVKYLVYIKISPHHPGAWYAGEFEKERYGWNFVNWGVSGLELDLGAGSPRKAIFEIRS